MAGEGRVWGSWTLYARRRPSHRRGCDSERRDVLSRTLTSSPRRPNNVVQSRTWRPSGRFSRRTLWDTPLRMYASDQADLLEAAKTPAAAGRR